MQKTAYNLGRENKKKVMLTKGYMKTSAVPPPTTKGATIPTPLSTIGKLTYKPELFPKLMPILKTAPVKKSHPLPSSPTPAKKSPPITPPQLLPTMGKSLPLPSTSPLIREIGKYEILWKYPDGTKKIEVAPTFAYMDKSLTDADKKTILGTDKIVNFKMYVTTKFNTKECAHGKTFTLFAKDSPKITLKLQTDVSNHKVKPSKEEEKEEGADKKRRQAEEDARKNGEKREKAGIARE